MGSRNDLIERVRDLLTRAGFYTSERCNLRPISFDLVARRDSRLLIVKVLGNADALGDRVAHELRVLARFLQASPLVVAERSGMGNLEDGVVYSHRGIPVLTLGSLRDHLLDNTAPLAFASPGGLYVSLRHEALKLLRIQRELSLGLLAEVAGVSRRAIQMYEEGMRATIDSALRLEEFLNESLVEPIDPFAAHERLEDDAKSPDPPRAPANFEGAILEMLRSVGFRVVPTQQSPFSALTQKTPERTNETILTGVERREPVDGERARLLSSVGVVTETKAMFVVSRETEKRNIEGTPVVQRRELEKLRDPQELVDLLRERARKGT